ncbi:hypothetical protein BC826DRAFT_1108144 [Russula brevipes]|nr:hypothetical protein BC826DRAFT_1108144 [Russula brevipes]
MPRAVPHRYYTLLSPRRSIIAAPPRLPLNGPVTPDKSIIPKQYHVFISPPFRRVFLGDSPAAGASTAIEDGLRAEIEALNTRVAALSNERAARLTQDSTRDSAREEARLSNMTIRISQLYLHFPEQAGEPPSVLRGFTDVDLRPCESKMVSITLCRYELPMWDVC